MPTYKVTAKLVAPTYIYTITADTKAEAMEEAQKRATEDYIDYEGTNYTDWKISLKLYKPLG